MLMKNKFNEQCITPGQIDLISNARAFFRRFAGWLRAYIISRYTGVGTPEEIFGRIYLETSNFGDMIRFTLGLDDAVGFTQRMNQIIFGLRDIIDAQFAGNSQAIQERVNRLYQNADDTASFLVSINPYFNQAEWNNLLRTYLQYNLETANLFSSGQYNKEIELVDRITDLTDQMGYSFAQAINDYITSGLQTNPTQQGVQCVTLEQVNDIYRIRTIWFDLTNWSRNFMLSKFNGIGDENNVHARLQQVPAEFINALRKFFGDLPIFESYEQALNLYVDLIDSLTTAMMEGNTDEVNRIVQLLYRDADERAAAFASLNPTYYSQSELQTRLYNNIRTTIDEASSFLTGDYSRNLDIYSTLLDQAESISGYISDGLIDYLNDQRVISSPPDLNVAILHFHPPRYEPTL
jgi:hypothetical protein